ncbi:MAG: BamA/TamA family outer membrane protein [Mucilaginibacter sp.]
MKPYYKFILFFVAVFFEKKGVAQQRNEFKASNVSEAIQPTELVEHKAFSAAYEDSLKQKDIFDIIAQLRKRQRIIKSDSITSKPSISYVPAIGYTLVSKTAIVLSGNAAFRTGPEARISTIIVSSSVTQRKQFTLPIQTNIWNKDNSFNFVGDYRLFKYPQSTFGLGSNSNINNEDPMDYSYFQFYETALKHIAGNIYAGVGYIIDDHWNVTDHGNFNGKVADYSIYGKSAHSIASGLTLNALIDTRNNGINPSKGEYFSLQYRDNYSFLGSSTPWRSLIIDVRKYIRFPENSENVLALWNYEWLILNGRPSYLDLPSTQWDESSGTGRGYIQGRFRGADMVYFEAEYRYRITANGLLGGTFFVNGQSLSTAPGSKLQTMQPGFGPGLRVKINKVSNTNISVDYGFGRQGSNGLFIDVGEIF